MSKLSNTTSPDNQDIDSMVSKILQSPDEEVLAILGRGYLQSYSRGVGLSRAFLVLTKKRLYYTGKALGKGYVDTTILNNKITGVEMHRNSVLAGKITLFILGAIFAVLGVIMLQGGGSDGQEIVFLGFGAITLLAALFLKPRRILRIKTSGGEQAVIADWFPDSEVREFRRSVMSVIIDE